MVPKQQHVVGIGTMEQEFPPVTQLEHVPQFFAKYSSFFTSSPPSALLLHLDAIFLAMEGVDHVIIPPKCKIKGFANGIGSRCAFKISLFWYRDDRLLCEFQRQSGCVILFNRFWRQTLKCLGDHSLTFPQSVMPLEPGMDCPTPPTEGLSFDAETLNQLVAMVGSDRVDVQREGSAALAAISQTNSLASALPLLLPLLKKLLVDSDEEISRYACIFLANLSAFDECRVRVVSTLLTQMLLLLQEPGAMGKKDSKRHVARALFECSKSKSCGKELLSCVSVLRRLEATQDSALQSSVSGTLRQLRIC
jgi:hypothetical protein